MEITQHQPAYIELIREKKYCVEGLSKSEQKIFELSVPTFENQKIRDMRNITPFAAKLHANARIRLGLRSDNKNNDEIDKINMALSGDLLKFPELTRDEIMEAVNLGIDGEFTEPDKPIFFSSSTFVRWIKQYIEMQKKPVMKKHLQLLHQIREDLVFPEISEQIKAAAKNANFYADQRRKDEAAVVIGAAGLYENIEHLHIYIMSIAEKKEIFSLIQERNPNLDLDTVKSLARNAAYNKFIKMLVDFDKMVSESGELMDMEL